MGNEGEEWRSEFEQAIGETFGEYICPPVPWEDASPHECCEVVCEVMGRFVTPSELNNMSEADETRLAHAFGEYFECEAPSFQQVKTAIAQTLVRWPVGSLGESDSTEIS